MEKFSKVVVMVLLLVVVFLPAGGGGGGVVKAQGVLPPCPIETIDVRTPLAFDYSANCGHCIPRGTPTPGGINGGPILVPTIEEQCTVMPSGNRCTYATRIPDWAETQFPANVTVPASCVWGPWVDEDGVEYPDLNLYQCGYQNPTKVAGWTCPYIPGNTPTPSPTQAGHFYLSEVKLAATGHKPVGVFDTYGDTFNYSVNGCPGGDISDGFVTDWTMNSSGGNTGANVTRDYASAWFTGGTWYGASKSGETCYASSYAGLDYRGVCNAIGISAGGTNTQWNYGLTGNQSWILKLTGDGDVDSTYAMNFKNICYGAHEPINGPTLTPTPDCNAMGTAVAATQVAGSSCGVPSYNDGKPIVEWDGVTVEPGECYTIIPAFQFTIPAVEGLWAEAPVGWGSFGVCTQLVTIPKLKLNIAEAELEIPLDIFVLPAVAWLLGLIIKL